MHFCRDLPGSSVVQKSLVQESCKEALVETGLSQHFRHQTLTEAYSHSYTEVRLSDVRNSCGDILVYAILEGDSAHSIDHADIGFVGISFLAWSILFNLFAISMHLTLQTRDFFLSLKTSCKP